MEIPDFWEAIRHIFEGEAKRIREIDLDNINSEDMAKCMWYLLENSRECTIRLVIAQSNQQIWLTSLHKVIQHIIQGEVKAELRLNFPALPAVNIYIDLANRISFGFVRGTWTALNVLAFFDLIYQLKQLAPDSYMMPNYESFTRRDHEILIKFWQDYNDAAH